MHADWAALYCTYPYRLGRTCRVAKRQFLLQACETRWAGEHGENKTWHIEEDSDFKDRDSDPIVLQIRDASLKTLKCNQVREKTKTNHGVGELAVAQYRTLARTQWKLNGRVGYTNYRVCPSVFNGNKSSRAPYQFLVLFSSAIPREQLPLTHNLYVKNLRVHNSCNPISSGIRDGTSPPQIPQRRLTGRRGNPSLG
jgi:hypothetical protein